MQMTSNEIINVTSKLFSEAIHDKCGISKNARVLVAISGGADSVALLHLLTQSGFRGIAAHCNFNLRGKESDADEKFVIELCSQMNVECLTISFETERYARNKKISIEMAARELRYDWFNKIATQKKTDCIATGHHGDDAIETFFLNLTRGSGIKGLTGIAWRNGNLVRPLLFASSQDIENYCKAAGLLFRTDSSNTETKYLRNKIRHQIVPLFKEINPSFFSTMQSNMEHLYEAKDLLIKETEKFKNEMMAGEGTDYLIPLKPLKEHTQKRSLLFELLRPFGFSGAVSNTVVNALNGIPGKQFFSDTHRLILDRFNLIITPVKESDQQIYSIEGGQENVNEPLRLSIREFTKDEGFILSKNPQVAHLDADLIDFPLTIRRPLQGDRFQPLGMDQFKKLSDFFIDEKLSLVDKENVWLLLNGNEIIWVIGKRIDNRFKISSSTKNVLEIKKDQ
jgi:tRNA(Ile)-lysidine synthase